ncbi:MAG: prepilin-type N-terminal cleavage/methylation domain-containing protein, partial [Deltaproteobacteria bacterium]|nr:prepilin-type N-terminal cleavage/methylation domain-containing protein [Deltaproteobacteria bacterium]
MSGGSLRVGRGFTLVELLIAVLLSSIVIIALGTLITNATKVFDTTSQS